MNFEEAKTLLNSATRWELRDHAFGDSEFGWNDAQGKEIAGGYSGGGRCSVWIYNPDGNTFRGESGKEVKSYSFNDSQARELKECGILGLVDRNDETGPDSYAEGYTMPGLTKEAVFKELTTKPKGMV